MLCALGQHQYLAALLEGARDFCGYGFSPGKVMDQMSENVLDACSGRQVDARLARSRQHLQIVWCAGRLGGRVPERPALHEDDRMLAISANRCGCQAQHELRLGPFEDGVERRCAHVVALVDDDLPVVFDQRVHLAQAGQRLHHGDVDLAGGFGFAAADSADHELAGILIQCEESLQTCGAMGWMDARKAHWSRYGIRAASSARDRHLCGH